MATISLEQAQAAKAEAQSVFSKICDVMGIGITKVGRRYAIKMNLRGPLWKKASAPKAVRGVPVKLEAHRRDSPAPMIQPEPPWRD
jgi:hypothetical protein